MKEKQALRKEITQLQEELRKHGQDFLQAAVGHLEGKDL